MTVSKIKKNNGTLRISRIDHRLRCSTYMNMHMHIKSQSNQVHK